MKNDAAVGHWRDLLTAAGVDASALTGRQVSCPICGGKDRFRFDNKQKRGTWYCNHCGAGDGYKMLELKTGETFSEAKKRIAALYAGQPAEKANPERDHRPALNYLWRSSVVASQEMHDYFVSRGLGEQHHWALRYNPQCPYTDGERKGKAPAIIARVYQDGKPVTLHRTFLTSDVPSKRMLMPHNGTLRGGYIPLFGMPADSQLGVAEGMETAMAARIIHKLQYPIWSCINAFQLEQFEPPKGIDSLSIFADNDKTFTGQTVGYSLARRHSLKIDSIVCKVHLPPSAGTDWNDVLLHTNEV